MKKLIETGFDEPKTDWLQKNIDEIANAPFSGIVVVCNGEAEDGKKINLRGVFCADTWHYHWFNKCLQDLEVMKPTHLKDNFIPIGVTPGNVDWFKDDAWKNVIEHWRIAARLAEKSGMKGILFDPEPQPDSNKIWDFRHLSQYHRHTFDEYRDKARERGGEVMKAIKDIFPEMTLFCYFMNSRNIFLSDKPIPIEALAGAQYGLYPSFIDGWLDEAPAEMKFVDGCEDAYLYTTKKQFQEAARRIKEDCQLLVSNENRAKYRAQVQVSFGIYLDAYVNEGPAWYIPPKDGSRLNQFRDNLLDALSFADEYVWIYGEDYRWWSTPLTYVKSVYWDQILPGVDATLRFAYAADAATYSYPNVVTWMLKTGFKTEKEMRLWCSVNYIAFWSEMAKTYADWFEPWSSILEWKPPYARWFLDAKCNIAHNCVDRHAEGAKKDKVAYIFVPESTDQPTQRITYRDLYKEVNKFANGLKSLGVQKGDRVMIYMPMIPQLPIAMLACAKIGAIHCIVFSGFSSGGLNSRILDAEAKIVVTTDGLYRRGKLLALKPNVDEATANTPSVLKVVVYRRTGVSVPMKEGKDIWWDDLVARQSDVCECEKMDSEDRLFILYSSGTTGKPKGIEHVHGGYCVTPAQTLHWVFDIKDSDVWWCTADIGWITGHSYIVYGPLTLGATSIMYEGSPDFPDLGRWFQIIQDNKVSKFYTAPTAIRMFMKAGEQWPKNYDLSSLKILGSVGEPITPQAWGWYKEFFGSNRCPIMDTWWVNESGCFQISPLPITELKPGSPTLPLPGFNIDVIDEDGNPVPPGTGGNIVINNPWPSMLRAFYRDSVRYRKEYWSTYWEIRPGTYLAGDKATKDEDGYFFIQGRIND